MANPLRRPQCMIDLSQSHKVGSPQVVERIDTCGACVDLVGAKTVDADLVPAPAEEIASTITRLSAETARMPEQWVDRPSPARSKRRTAGLGSSGTGRSPNQQRTYITCDLVNPPIGITSKPEFHRWIEAQDFQVPFRSRSPFHQDGKLLTLYLACRAYGPIGIEVQVAGFIVTIEAEVSDRAGIRPARALASTRSRTGANPRVTTVVTLTPFATTPTKKSSWNIEDSSPVRIDSPAVLPEECPAYGPQTGGRRGQCQCGHGRNRAVAPDGEHRQGRPVVHDVDGRADGSPHDARRAEIDQAGPGGASSPWSVGVDVTGAFWPYAGSVQAPGSLAWLG